MHIRVRTLGKPDSIVVVESKLTKIEQFRRIVKDKFDVDPKLQRLFYGGKLLEDGYTFHDYNIKLNDVIQLMVKLQAQEDSEIKLENKDDKTKVADPSNDKKIEYKDAVSQLYSIGDLVDMRDREQGAWFEGKVIRIVYDPEKPVQTPEIDCQIEDSPNKDSDSENNPPSSLSSEDDTIKSKQKSIAEYFSKSINKKAASKMKKPVVQNNDENLLFAVQLDADEEDSRTYCKLKEIRPRARNVMEVSDIEIGQKVMINYNTEEPSEKGYWYDFKVEEVKKTRTTHELIGTLYLGPDAVPQNDTRVKVHDKIFAIEVVVPAAQRNNEYIKTMTEQPEKRSMPLNCLTCRDDEEALCKDCGCYLCSRKEQPEKIVLCDECNKGYHMDCLTPPLTELPDEDWYCPSCKRDPNDVVAPGAAKQTKKTSTSKSNKDWGRGMACVGKTKTCSMPTNHFGPIPGIEVGMCWRFRIQLSESGVHRPPVSGIHGRDVEGAYSIVLSGGYEDDVDNGIEFTYTGSGGRDLSGNKRTAEQSCDQTLTRENKALARNCAVKKISEEGGDAGEEWRSGKPVRVVRSYKMIKHFPKYAPKEGIRYDGIYKVVKYYPEKGLSGYRVWKYLLRRDDPSPAPWEPGAKHFPLVYPDGYLEAEAEKRALKGKNNKDGKINNGKRKALRESNHSTGSEDESTPPAKKVKSKEKADQVDKPKKRGRPSKNKSVAESPQKPVKIPDIFNIKSPKTKKASEQVLSEREREAINEDTLNNKLWKECLAVCESKGKKEFIEHVTQVFLCIICQEVAANPVTTPCLHNFCMSCIKLAFKSNGSQTCSYCRQSLAKYEPQHNEHLKAALRALMPGYDAGKK